MIFRWFLAAAFVFVGVDSWLDQTAEAETIVSLPSPLSAESDALLLPSFVVDFSDPDGVSTLFAIHNDDATLSASVIIEYYRANGSLHPGSDPAPMVLGPAEVLTVNIRSVPDLDMDEDGFARGYVKFVAEDGARIVGDFFLVNTAEAFASGDRLVNIDPESAAYDLCESFKVRYLEGGGFSGGTQLSFWLDLEIPPPDENPDPVAAFVAYDLSGEIIAFSSIFTNQISFEIEAVDLLAPFTTQPFGILEIQFLDGIQGHVAATYDAFGLFSVGLAATCTQ